MKKKHKCQEGITCRCSSTACEPNDDCPIHGYPWPPRCEICGKFMKHPDRHLFCPSWPNCDIEPGGCAIIYPYMGDEYVGHKG